ncbi:hypothetical protein F5Y10DRAFT_283739 [Nemania abortiva]|nr:hypothetical protein F5Y10DRAFT_283739 [Nemania abortiva]
METEASSQLLSSGDNNQYRNYEFRRQDGRWKTEDPPVPQETANNPSSHRLASLQWAGENERIGLEEPPSIGPHKDSSSSQRLKVVQSDSLRPAIKQVLLFQLPPLAFTSALLGLYLKRIYWNPTSDQLSALLVASKVHETLIVASSFHILYYHIRRGLLGRSGIPFGFLTAPFQLTSPFYLLTSEFWSGVRYMSSKSALLASLVIVTFLLSALAGASSGIIILPRLGWHTLPLQESSDFTNGKLVGYAILDSEAIFPSIIDLSIIPNVCLNPGDHPEHPAHCPFSDLTDASAAIYTNFVERGYWPLSYEANLTISGTDIRLINFWRNFSTPSLGFSVATTPLSYVRDIFGSTITSFTGSQHGMIKLTAELHANGDVVAMKQPRVTTQCSSDVGIRGSRDNTPYYEFVIDQSFYAPFNFTVPVSIFQYDLERDKEFGFIDVNQYLPKSVRASVAIWVRNNSGVKLCLVDARWMESDAWIIPSDTRSKILHSLTLNTSHNRKYANLDVESFIHINPSWCDLLNQRLYDSRPLSLSSNASSVFELLVAYSTFSGIEAGLTIILADALSAVPNSRTWHIERYKLGAWKPNGANNDVDGALAFSRISNSEDYMILSVGYYHNLYTYSFSGTTTILSWIVLLLHFLLVSIHILVLIMHGGRMSDSWGRLGELVCLAFNSQPTNLLENTGAGVTGGRIWGINASVREVGSGERVELVLRDGKSPDDHMLIRQNRPYG